MSVGPSVYNPLPKEGLAAAWLHLCGEDGRAQRALSCYLLSFHVRAAAQNILTLKLCVEADQAFALPETLSVPLFSFSFFPLSSSSVSSSSSPPLPLITFF